jgi:hypothetical protein
MKTAHDCAGSVGLCLAVKISDFAFKCALDWPIPPQNEEEGEL